MGRATSFVGCRRRFLLLSAGLALPLGLATCAIKPTGPAKVTLVAHGGTDQNPDPDGHATPVVIRLYQLAATGRFERASEFAMLAHQAETLGTETLASNEFLLSPGQTRTISEPLQKGARFVGIAVLFRDIDHAVWRLTAPVAAGGTTRLTLDISGLRATLASGGS